MNNPRKDLFQEMEFISKNFDFLDLTIEPETAYADNVDTARILEFRKKNDLLIIGHTPWNLPIASPFESVRKAAFEEFLKCLKVFRKLKVKLVNVHPALPNDATDPDLVLQYNIDFFKKIVKEAKKYKIKIMVENTKAIFNELNVLATILKQVPGLKLHWDVGHANLGNEGEKKTKQAFHIFKNRIAHLHFSDNNGQEDQHLPLGTGNINWPFIVKTLLNNKYDKTITLEIHSSDPSYLLFSRDKLRYILNNIGEA